MSFGYLPGRGALGNWSVGSVVDPSEFWWFEDSISKSLDGYAGGSYAPSSAIVVGGSGIEVSTTLASLGDTTIGTTGADTLTVNAATGFASPVSLSSSLTLSSGADAVFGGDVTIGASAAKALTVNAEATFASGAQAIFDGPVTLNSDATIGVTSGQDLDVNSTANFAGPVNIASDTMLGDTSADSLTINATTTINSPVSISFAGTLSVASASTFTGTTNISGTANLGASYANVLSLKGILDASGGSGGHIEYGYRALGDSDTSISIDEGPVIIQEVALTAGRTLTISTTYKGSKSPLLFVRNDSPTFSLYIAGSAGVYVGGSGYAAAAVLYLSPTSGLWVAVMRGT